MGNIRSFFGRHALLAMVIVIAAIGLRALVPTGYMASASAHGITVELCSGIAGRTMTVALPGANHDRDDQGKGGADAPCAFSGLGAGLLSAIDPFILAIAIAYVMAAVFRRITARVASTPSFLRPPLRGPPALI